MKVNRQAVIKLDGESEHVVNYFRESFLAENPKLADIEKQPESVVITGLPAHFAGKLAGNHVLGLKYGHALVQKKGVMIGPLKQQEKATEITIPKTAEFDELIQELSPVAQNIYIKPASYVISFSPTQMSPVLQHKSFEAYQFARMLSNVSVECSEIVLVGQRTNIQDFNTPVAFMKYIQTGKFETPGMNAEDITRMSESLKNAVPYINAGVILTIVAAIGTGGYFAFKALAPLLDTESKMQPYEEFYRESTSPSYTAEKAKALRDAEENHSKTHAEKAHESKTNSVKQR